MCLHELIEEDEGEGKSSLADRVVCMAKNAQPQTSHWLVRFWKAPVGRCSTGQMLTVLCTEATPENGCGVAYLYLGLGK